MVWDFAEANPLRRCSSAISACSAAAVATALERVPAGRAGAGHAGRCLSATPRQRVIATDPPYYDNIGYSDLSDFFYVWLRRSLRSIHPRLC